MAKHAIDPVLQELVKSINETGHAAVPVTISARGTVLTGSLIAQGRYFAELVEGNPLMSALEPTSGLLGKEYVKDVEDEADHHLHLRGARISTGDSDAGGLWRISLHAVDAWALRDAAEPAGQHDKGPFARLLGGA